MKQPKKQSKPRSIPALKGGAFRIERGKDDILYKKKIKEKIERLKKKRNAVIMVHNYQRDEVQEIADISGDSLALARAAVKTNADIIIFCGVRFMAESASILNPDKKVLLPVKEAGCPWPI